uniref:Uncharacterized protein n=1 Tax=Caldanaerobius polysaccharolyticus TaxID=44256 RepID=I6RCT7_9THEO|nr:Hypothetical protein [Caldanaerobius polysaccharolyticus]
MNRVESSTHYTYSLHFALLCVSPFDLYILYHKIAKRASVMKYLGKKKRKEEET